MTAKSKIEKRRATVATTYASTMKWAKTVGYVAADTSEDIHDFYGLPPDDYAGAMKASLAGVIGEYDGLTYALAMLEEDA